MAAPIPGGRSAQASTSTSTTPTPTTITPVRLTQNELADRRALSAYASYLTTLLSLQAVGQTNDSAFTTTVSEQCKAALAPLAQPPDEIDTTVQHTLTALGEEMGDDLSINFDAAALPAFTKFSDVLTRLHWKPLSGAALVVKHYTAKESAVLELTASNLCLDATDAQLKPSVIPDATRTFIKSYADASEQANYALSAMMTLLQTYEVPSEKALVGRISVLAGELSTDSKADLLQSGTALSTVLEAS